MQRAVCGVTALVLAADQVSKSLVLAARPGAGGGPVPVRLVRNTGASLGAGPGHPAAVTLVSAVIAVLLARPPSRVAALLLAVVLGGAGAVAVMLGTGAHLRRWLSTRRDAS
jgi:lipoprotein signal peptidase